jgi:hypothetical protein
LKLYAVTIGGDIPGAHIEVHDVRFVVAPAITETYAELRRQWWGTPRSLHIDSWVELTCADGHDIALRPEPFAGPEKLWFVNLGGYEAGVFGESHRNVFVVAGNERQARARALRRVADWLDPHRDALFEAEKAFALAARPLHIHLTPAATAREPEAVSQYLPIGRT